MDNDSIVLQSSASSVNIIDLKYRELKDKPSEQFRLKKYRDRAFSTYSIARLELLGNEVICTTDDIKEMQAIRKEIEQAAETQGLIQGAIRLIRFLIAL